MAAVTEQSESVDIESMRLSREEVSSCVFIASCSNRCYLLDYHNPGIVKICMSHIKIILCRLSTVL